jgi:hypothetical protein
LILQQEGDGKVADLRKATAVRFNLGKISVSTLGDVKGIIEAAGLYTPAISLS